MDHPEEPLAPPGAACSASAGGVQRGGVGGGSADLTHSACVPTGKEGAVRTTPAHERVSSTARGVQAPTAAGTGSGWRRARAEPRRRAEGAAGHRPAPQQGRAPET